MSPWRLTACPCRMEQRCRSACVPQTSQFCLCTISMSCVYIQCCNVRWVWRSLTHAFGRVVPARVCYLCDDDDKDGKQRTNPFGGWSMYLACGISYISPSATSDSRIKPCPCSELRRGAKDTLCCVPAGSAGKRGSSWRSC
jgi:hypothetical protein